MTWHGHRKIFPSPTTLRAETKLQGPHDEGTNFVVLDAMKGEQKLASKPGVLVTRIEMVKSSADIKFEFFLYESKPLLW